MIPKYIIDIVQQIGRAIRKVRDKSIGTIIVPIFIEKGKDMEETISKSKFEKLIWVTNALKSHDSYLVDELNEYRTNLGRKKGRVGGGPTLPPEIILDLPSEYGKEFIKAIESKVVLSTSKSWYFWYGKLLDYFNEFGNVLVKSDYSTEDGYSLGYWVSNNRARKHLLDQDQIKKLDDIGFIWEPLDAKWEEMFKKVSKLKEKTKGFYASDENIKAFGKELFTWINTPKHL